MQLRVEELSVCAEHPITLNFTSLPSLLIIRVERVGYSGGTFKRVRVRIRNSLIFQSSQKEANGSAPNSSLRILGGSTLNLLPHPPSVDTEWRQQLAEKLPEIDLTGNYQLRAVSVHSGNANGGHFITYRRGIGADNVSTWYRTSDAEVICFFPLPTFPLTLMNHI
ncbi:unnamed protein product [Gongylonema pulchrum]|uniref:USP domain-containing protein n=1 Tax=Gongylonema pulchrum TaxID=637853 RepID=A0A183EQ81_9BILA|nr:unnamed protein product [Gongylonema pulchrum]